MTTNSPENTSSEIIEAAVAAYHEHISSTSDLAASKKHGDEVIESSTQAHWAALRREAQLLVARSVDPALTIVPDDYPTSLPPSEQ